MGVLTNLHEALVGTSSTLHECRDCGEKLEADADECPSCGSAEIASYEF